MRRAISASKAAARAEGADATPVRGGAFPEAAGNNVAYDSPPGTNTRARPAANSSGVFFAAAPERRPSHEERRLDGVRRRFDGDAFAPARGDGARAALEAARSRGMFGGETARGPASVPVGVRREEGGRRRGGARRRRRGGERGVVYRRERGEKDGGAREKDGMDRATGFEPREAERDAGGARRGRFGRFAGGGGASRREEFSSADDFDVGPLDALNLREAARGTAGQRGRGAMLVELGLPDHNFARTTI